ncbi:helix-turn-helix domain-containing protein [Fundidesulfovibrio agrisoli]|uniref:helix-turn-helix domain-containing protein n=1 Tax=Fundidesulfovibrio agrisoli TaxID=2922717 RepID=UPI0024348333|nr:helix-turn-helix domain-containing protein [Fundidesulfovibrio agrisoli]
MLTQQTVTNFEAIAWALTAGCDCQSLFYRIDRNVVTSGKWSSVKGISRSVYPVLMAHCGVDQTCYPSEERIADLCGVSVKRVPSAVKDLCGKGFMTSSKSKPNARGHRHNIYRLASTPPGGNPVFMHNSLVKDGHWAKLPSRAHALYVAMRCRGHLDYDTFVDVTQAVWELSEDGDSLMDLQESASEDFRAVYRDRAWEVCDADPDVLMGDAGFSRNTFKAAMADLEAARFTLEVPGLDRRTWAVAIRQPFPLEPVQ